MSVARWQDEYCAENSQIDQEHQKLFVIVNTLHDAMVQGMPQSVLVEMLENPAIHTVDRFQTEEAMMWANSYPGYESHKQAHDGLKTKVVNLLQKFNSSETLITVDLTCFLTEWLVHHIRGEDQKMIRFFREQVSSQAVKR